MSDEGDRTCPLCAEEMDLTDQQLKPCKCGYEICVWCWHHIMDMAEKDETEGRCPACRTPYNKERIVGTAASCEKLVAEWNVEKKHKSHKGKNKTSEGRKQLSSVRVIQRNLVYIVGLPLNLADEDLLQRKEYFGQYGKVLKVSISRTAAGAIQHFANNTCSVYITYGKEDEAIRCIQSVHGFVLDGRPLRACFGTTKYCHAWLRNVPCTNPDCLYLHEIGSQEDSFTKDEIISAYTRVQQTMGSTNNTQRRSGGVLPPPADDYSNNSSGSAGKPISKNATANQASNVRSSPPNSSSGRSVGLPAGALWGTRASSNHPPSASMPSSNGSLKPKTDTSTGSVTFSAAVTNTNQPLQTAKKQNYNVETNVVRCPVESSESVKKYSDVDPGTTTSETSGIAIPPTSDLKSQIESNDIADSEPNSIKDGGRCLDKEVNDSGEGDRNILESAVPSIGINGRHQLQGREHNEQYGEPTASHTVKEAVDSAENVTQVESRAPPLEVEDDVVAFNNQRHNDPEVITDRSYLPPNLTNSFHLSSHSSGHSLRNDVEGSLNLNVHLQAVDNNVNLLAQGSNIHNLSNGYLENQADRCDALGYNVEQLFPNDGKRKQAEMFEREVASSTHDSVDAGESSIISNILSLDLDPWDEPLTSPQNLVKMLGEANNKQGSLVSSSRRVHNSNQSRFSFAREEEPTNQAPYLETSLGYVRNASQTSRFSHDFNNDRSLQFDKFSTLNGFSLVNPEESELFGSTHSYSSSNKQSVSRSQISAPPGFSTPSRAPPPGFTSHERVEHSFDPFSGHHMLDTSSLLRDQFQPSAAGNVVSNGDIEFMDPAILAVGKGRIPSSINSSGLDIRSNFSQQFNSFENEARLQSLMQRSVSPHQNQRFADMRETFSPLNNGYGIPNRVVDHAFTNNLSAFSQLNFPHSRNAVTSNGHWEGWNEAQSGHDLALAELLRNERLGFKNKFYASYEDSKFRLPSSGDIYNRTFGM